MPAFENQNAPEHIPNEEHGLEHIPKSEIVDAFRTNIEIWFVRYQNFYDRSNAAMRSYRFAHVDLITSIYNNLMTVFGEDIEAIRQSAYELMDLIETRTTDLGGTPNACLEEVITEHAASSRSVGSAVQVCAIYSNVTLANLLRNVFYPTFADIQTTISTVPVAVIDVLSRGNVLQDEEAIIEFLAARYEVIELQWLGAVSQLLRWETNRFEVDGSFLVDEMTQCMTTSILTFITTNARLEGVVRGC